MTSDSIPDPTPELPAPSHDDPSPEDRVQPQEAHELSETMTKILEEQPRKGEREPLVAAAHGQLARILKTGIELRLLVTPYELLLSGYPVYESKEPRNVAYRLYYDGLRELRLLPGLQPWELADLLDILNPSGADVVHNTVTLLKDRNLPHVSFTSADIFHMDFFHDWEEETESAQDTLFMELQQQTRETPQGASAFWSQADHLPWELQDAASDETHGGVDGLRSEAGQIPDDLWSRGYYMMFRLLGESEGEDRQELTHWIIRMVDGLLNHERWDELSLLGKTLDAALGPEIPEALQDGAEILRGALGELLDEGRLFFLDTLALSSFQKLNHLLKVLPPEADAPLVGLLESLPEGPVQACLLELLLRRGVNPLDLDILRTGSADPELLNTAIKALGAAGTPEAADALVPLLQHPDARTRLAALRAMEDQIDPSLIPAIADTLYLGHLELRSLCLDLLDRLPAGAVTEYLMPLIRQQGLGTMTLPQRQRVLRVIGRAGTREASSFLVKQLLQVNLIGARSADSFRQEIIDALVEEGGETSREILAACLESFTLPGLRSSVKAALARLERREQTEEKG